MKAYEIKNLLGGLSLNFNADKKIKVHQERLAKIKGIYYHYLCLLISLLLLLLCV